MKTIGKTKALFLSVAMLAGLLLPSNLSAQKGLFHPEAENPNNNSILGRGGDQNGMEWSGGGMITQDPTQEAPLGSGLLILAAIGVSYATLKKKEDKQ